MAIDVSDSIKKVSQLSSDIKKYQKREEKQLAELFVLQKELAELQSSSSSTQEQITNKKAQVDAKQTQVTGTQEYIKLVEAELATVRSGLENYSSASELGKASNKDATSGASTYEYNPPLVKEATFATKGPQGSTIDGDIQKFMDDATAADTYWKDGKLGKGVIQQSAKFPYSFTTSLLAPKVADTNTLYGFRFLYNPTEVYMNWGVSTEIDAAKFMAGELLANPTTDAASASSITFSVILNRMLDMKYVDSNGMSTNDSVYTTSDGTISSTHAKGIYNKGTMYDIEYLFKAVNGLNSSFVSSIGLTSSDPGWMNSFPVELHLGLSLRYLVRVTNLEVNHKIFNERMVPIFSIVNMVCKRLPDFQSVVSSSENANAGGGGGGFAGGRNLVT